MHTRQFMSTYKLLSSKRLYSSFIAHKRSPFEILNLSTSASSQDIKKRYKELAKNLHPDKKDTGDLAKFQELVKAYELLIDPNKRSYYLKSGYGWNNETFARDATYPPPGHRPASYTNAYWANNVEIHENYLKNTTFLSVLAAVVLAIATANFFYFQSSHAALLSAADQHHMKSSEDLKRARTEAKLFGNDRGVKRVIDNRMKEFRSEK
ncbi:unnamed protein product [Mucor hiemalis]